MSNNRKKWREKQKKKRREEMLDKRNAYGMHDLVPYLAVKRIIQNDNKLNNFTARQCMQ